MEVIILASALSFLIGVLSGATMAFGWIIRSFRVITTPVQAPPRTRVEDLRPRDTHE